MQFRVRCGMCPHLGEDEDREPDRVGPKIVAGFAVAGAGIRLGPEAALALGAASPLFESLAERAWQELRPDARQRAALVLSTAARQAQHQPLDTRGCWRSGRGCAARWLSYFFTASLRCQVRSVAGVTGNTSAQRRRNTIRASAANQARSAGSYRTRPTCRRSTAFSCWSTSISAAIARSPRNSTTTRPSVRQISA